MKALTRYNNGRQARPRQNGFTLIELLMALLVSAVVVGAGIAIYKLAFGSTQATSSVKHVQAVMGNISEEWGNSHNFSALTTSVGIKAKIFPKSMVNASAGAVTDEWNGSVSLTGSSSSYKLTLNGVPTKACQQLGEYAGGALKVSVNGTSVSGSNVSPKATPGAIAGDCSKSGSGTSGGNVVVYTGN